MKSRARDRTSAMNSEQTACASVLFGLLVHYNGLWCHSLTIETSVEAFRKKRSIIRRSTLAIVSAIMLDSLGAKPLERKEEPKDGLGLNFKDHRRVTDH